MNAEALALRVAELALERKALEVVAIDVRGRTGYTDFLVIASGTSDRHVQAVADMVVTTLKKEDGLAAIGTEGLRQGQWALADFGGVVLHVFHQFTREVYDLDGMWRDAPRLSINPPTEGASAAP